MYIYTNIKCCLQKWSITATILYQAGVTQEYMGYDRQFYRGHVMQKIVTKRLKRWKANQRVEIKQSLSNSISYFMSAQVNFQTIKVSLVESHGPPKGQHLQKYILCSFTRNETWSELRIYIDSWVMTKIWYRNF